MAKNRFFITTVGLALGASFGLTGCMYSDTLAPVYNISSSSPSRPSANQSVGAQPIQNSIEQPGSPVVVNNSQNDPYSDATAMAGTQQNSTIRPDMRAQQSMDSMSESAKIAASHDPRIKDARDVLSGNDSPVNQQKPFDSSQAARPQSVTPSQVANQRQEAPNVGTANSQKTTTKTQSAQRPQASKPQSATKTLLQEARASVAAGNYDKAASALERAHRIEPTNAKILYDIAQIRYAQGKYAQADSFASKAANYSQSSPTLSKKIWTILANSRKALGNSTGALAAARKAASF